MTYCLTTKVLDLNISLINFEFCILLDGFMVNKPQIYIISALLKRRNTKLIEALVV